MDEGAPEIRRELNLRASALACATNPTVICRAPMSMNSKQFQDSKFVIALFSCGLLVATTVLSQVLKILCKINHDVESKRLPRPEHPSWFSRNSQAPPLDDTLPAHSH